MENKDLHGQTCPMGERGLLIVIEGIDGAGKSTQAKALVSFLKGKGIDALYLFEPTSGKYGSKIREMADAGERETAPDEEYRLFLMDRKENVEENILPALEENKVVVEDRYYFSTMAYQGALGLDVQRIKEENEAIAPVPDLLIYLSIPVKMGQGRIVDTRGVLSPFEKREYLVRVKSIFDALIAPLPYAITIDATDSEERVSGEIKAQVMKLLSPVLDKT